MQQAIPRQSALGGHRALIGALILGAVAAGLIVAFLANREGDTDSSAAGALAVRTTVVVAAVDISAGEKITRANVETRQVPRDLLLLGALTDTSAVVGQTARYPIAKGEQIATPRLVVTKESKSVSFQIPPGLRGFTIGVETKTSPAALMVPGDFVDVLVSGDITRLSPLASSAAATLLLTNGDKPKAAVTLLQNVQVLSVQRDHVDTGVVYDSSTRGNPPGEKDDVSFITLALTPEQSQLLWLASQENKVTVSLRGFGDDTVTELPTVAEPIRVK